MSQINLTSLSKLMATNIPTDVVFNSSYGGASLSRAGAQLFNELKGYEKGHENYVDPDHGYFECPRHDPDLVEVVRRLRKDASGRFSNLEIVTIPSPIYYIEEYDGQESVMTPAAMSWVIAETPEVIEKYPALFL